jgi:hypothetical protein
VRSYYCYPKTLAAVSRYGALVKEKRLSWIFIIDNYLKFVRRRGGPCLTRSGVLGPPSCATPTATRIVWLSRSNVVASRLRVFMLLANLDHETAAPGRVM